MNTKYEPCSICEKYMDGVVCYEHKCPVAKMKAEIERLEDYNENLLAANVGLSCGLLDEIQRAKAEAIKEFAERMKAYLLLRSHGQLSVVSFEDIDKLVKEMTEEQR